MAKEEVKEEGKEQSGDSKESTGGKKGGGGLFLYGIITAMAVSGLVGGFALAQLLAVGEQKPITQEQPTQQETPTGTTAVSINTDPSAMPWYEPLDSVVANLDEPGVTRFLRAEITLEMSPQFDEIEGKKFLEARKLVLRDWLTTFIAGLSLEDVRGTKNLSRIKNQIRDQFNDLLFPEGKPMVKGVFLKEFAVQ